MSDTKPPHLGPTGAELLVRQMVRLGVDVLFLNPGTDTAPVQEALADLRSRGEDTPEVVLCPHEAVALAAAHGYHAVTGRPQVVMVHVDVGTQNLGAMVHDVDRGHGGVLVIAGRTPATGHGELLGGRDHVVHWQQDVPDQAGILRGYAKWTADADSVTTLARTLTRGLQVAAATPAGLAYLTVAREVLMARTSARHALPDPARSPIPTVSVPTGAVIEDLVARLRAARSPLVISSRLGRNPEAVPHLVTLCEMTGARVLDRRERVNMPSDHPAYLRDDELGRKALAEADLVLVVDNPVPWVPQLQAPPAQASVVVIDNDPLHASMPSWSFDVDLLVQGDPGQTLRQVCAALREAGATQDAYRDLPSDPVTVPSDEGAAPFLPATVARALDEVLGEDDLVVEEATTNAPALRAHLSRRRPGTLFHPGGSGLGWPLGAALGVSLAAPTSRVLAVLGDGSLLFSQPLAALSALRMAGRGVVVVVLQNGGYAASRRPVFELYPDGVSAAAGEVVGTRFDAPVDVRLLAESCGAVGTTPSTLAELRGAVREGLAVTRRGVTTVVGVPVTSPWFSGVQA